ncbi:MAG: 1-acyl-sn-glycerol-3-phosphate acyltransferase, partial [Bdellovibrionales bacterium]|nr:1-acyl-sn-glycerol-3-phosphate acyltransferase [Oligoflexia bacterium]
LRFHSNYFFLGPFGVFARAVMGVKLSFIHRERLDACRPAVFLGNHQSGSDLGIMGTACPERSVIVAKKEIQNIPIFGWFFKIAGNLMIDRKKTFEAKTQMEEIRETMKRRDLNLVIFPEGTRSKTQTFLPFKKGAFHLAIATGYPVVPVICSSLKGKAVWETFDLKGGHVIISVLNPIETKDLGVRDLDQFKDRVRNIMLAEFERINLLAASYDSNPELAKQART